jgi:hypothetical protein
MKNQRRTGTVIMSTSRIQVAKMAWGILCKAITKPATEWLVAFYDDETMDFLSDASSQNELKCPARFLGK